MQGGAAGQKKGGPNKDSRPLYSVLYSVHENSEFVSHLYPVMPILNCFSGFIVVDIDGIKLA